MRMIYQMGRKYGCPIFGWSSRLFKRKSLAFRRIFVDARINFPLASARILPDGELKTVGPR